MKKVEKEQMLEERAVQNVEERSISAAHVPSAQSAQSSNAQNSQERSVHAQEQPVHVPGVEVKNLHVSFGQNHVVNNVSFRVMPGDFVGLLGPNGAGKTTLFRTIMGLQKSCAGEVLFHTEHDKHYRTRYVGYVPQRHDVAWDFPISVLDVVLMGRIRHIGYGRRARIEDYRAALTALERTGMLGFKDRVIGELSGGQRQRVLVARALAGQPHILLLDEPFTGLDMPSQELLTDLFHKLTDEGESIIMSSHDIVGSIQSCSRILLFNGSIVGDDAPSALTAAQWAQTFNIREDSSLIRLITKDMNHA